MSEGPIKRERAATRPPAIRKPPELHDVVTVDDAPLGYTHWRVHQVPSTKLGRTDIILLRCVDPNSPLQFIRRRVFQTRPHDEEIKQ